MILPGRRHVDLVEVNGIGSPTDCKPACALIIHSDNGTISFIVPFGESLPLEVVAAPAEKLLDNRSLCLKIEGLYEEPVILCDRSKYCIHRAILEYLTLEGGSTLVRPGTAAPWIRRRVDRRHVSFRLNVALTVRVSKCFGPLIALGFVALPTVSIAACVPGAKPSYQDISTVYFRSEGVSEPVAIRLGETVQPGACPVTVKLYISPGDVEKGGGRYCFTDRSGEVRRCCGATDSSTDDSPQLIFNRLVAVLARDRFYDIAEASQPIESDGAAFYSIVVMRCGAQPKGKGAITFLGPPQPEPNTSILALSIPFGSSPRVTYDPKILTLFDDFTRAIYQFEWTLEDIY